MRIITIFALLLAGCAHHKLEIPNDQVLDSVSHYKAHGELSLVTDEQKHRLTSENAPKLWLTTKSGCSLGTHFSNACIEERSIPLRQIRTDGETLSVVVAGFSRAKTIEFNESEIETAEIHFDDAQDDFDPNWAFGVMLLGPVGFLGPHAHWIPTQAMVVDVGLMGAPHVFSAFSGVRFRPVQFGNVRPFVGGVANFMNAAGTTIDSAGEEVASNESSYRAGPRIGADIELSKRRVLVGIEADLFYTFEGDGFILGEAKTWQPFAGAYVAYQL